MPPMYINLENKFTLTDHFNMRKDQFNNTINVFNSIY